MPDFVDSDFPRHGLPLPGIANNTTERYTHVLVYFMLVNTSRFGVFPSVVATVKPKLPGCSAVHASLVKKL